MTLIGWLPATIWAVYALSQFKTDQKIRKVLGDECLAVAPTMKTKR